MLSQIAGLDGFHWGGHPPVCRCHLSRFPCTPPHLLSQQDCDMFSWYVSVLCIKEGVHKYLGCITSITCFLVPWRLDQVKSYMHNFGSVQLLQLYNKSWTNSPHSRTCRGSSAPASLGTEFTWPTHYQKPWKPPHFCHHLL